MRRLSFSNKDPDETIFILKGRTLENLICEYLEFIYVTDRRTSVYGDLKTKIDSNPRIKPTIFFSSRLKDGTEVGLTNTIRGLKKAIIEKREENALKGK